MVFRIRARGGCALAWPRPGFLSVLGWAAGAALLALLCVACAAPPPDCPQSVATAYGLCFDGETGKRVPRACCWVVLP